MQESEREIMQESEREIMQESEREIMQESEREIMQECVLMVCVVGGSCWMIRLRATSAPPVIPASSGGRTPRVVCILRSGASDL